MLKKAAALAVLATLAAGPVLAQQSMPGPGPAGQMPMMQPGQGGQCPMGGFGGFGHHGKGFHGMGHHMGMTRHPDGQAAFLKAELKITPDQQAAWDQFAEALKVSSASKAAVWSSAGDVTTIDQMLERRERVQTTRLEDGKRLRAAWTKLNGVLSEDQRKAALDLFRERLMIF